jgi:tRNA nucleotidyltransferase (CCA-adding enzyme)
MDIYLVGGAIRDELLGLEVRERDWVVVGATPAQMLALGYSQVGRDFPVFLHPETGEEYALARSERKKGHGYRGFEVQANPGIGLEEDLKRRDLSINAMARDHQGRLIDPYGGLDDLKARRMRHVSAAFSEDPVRLLRIARFAARFTPLGFVIAPETQLLLRQMVEDGEVDHLVPERVWQEMAKALAAPAPEQFFRVLCSSGAMQPVLPELVGLCQEVGAPQGRLQAFARATPRLQDPGLRFAALCMDLAVEQLQNLNRRLPIPNDLYRLARLAIAQRPALEQAAHLDAEAIMRLFEATDALRRPDAFRALLQLYVVCVWTASPLNTPGRLERALSAAQRVKAQSLTGGLKGPAIAKALREARVKAIGAEGM